MELKEIKSLLDNDQVDKAIEIMEEAITEDTDNDELFYLLGNAYCRKNNWQQAMNAYCEAIDINPDSPAKTAYNRVTEILDFYNHDMYNP